MIDEAAKIRARSQLKAAVTSGRLKRGGCQECGAVPADGHHPDYSKPLAVEWLCKPHHRARHGWQTLPSWAHGVRAYTARTRPRWLYAKSFSYSEASDPNALLRNLERIWRLFKTDEERDYGFALIQRLRDESEEASA